VSSELSRAFIASLLVSLRRRWISGRPPPSKDPLLQRPKIGFDRHMVLVIISHEPNCFIDLDIVRIELTSEAMEVLATIPSRSSSAEDY
jgi:hypothetical protein